MVALARPTFNRSRASAPAPSYWPGRAEDFDLAPIGDARCCARRGEDRFALVEAARHRPPHSKTALRRSRGWRPRRLQQYGRRSGCVFGAVAGAQIFTGISCMVGSRAQSGYEKNLKTGEALRGSSWPSVALPPWARSYDHGGVVSRKVQKTTVIQNFLVQQCLLGTIGTISSHGRGWRQFAAVSWRGSSGGLGPRQAPPLSVFEASMIFSPGCRPAPSSASFPHFARGEFRCPACAASQSGVAMHDESRAWALYEDRCC